MPYYQGDFYRGDYYGQGDPGFFSFLGKAVKSVAGFIPGVGGLVAKAAGAIIPVSKGASVPRQIGRIAGTAVSAIARHPVLSAAGAAGAIGAMGASRAVMGMPSAMGGHRAMRGTPGEKGFHQSKKHPGVWVRNRRMNVCNPRALRRSIRRAHGFAKLAMRTIHLVHPKKKARFGGFRKHRAKK
jgi:hypothetical protein